MEVDATVMRGASKVCAGLGIALARKVAEETGHLGKEIGRNELEPLADSTNSAIEPEQHQDGRIFIMNYEDPAQKTALTLAASFSKRFRVAARTSLYGRISTSDM